jgi:hypothetical protein
MSSKTDFIAQIYPAALAVSATTGLSWQTMLAQAAQETGWGGRLGEPSPLPGWAGFHVGAGDGRFRFQGIAVIGRQR